MSSSSSTECPICRLDRLLKSAPCGHEACSPCWAAIRRTNRRCPFCRIPVDTPTSSDEYTEMGFGEEFIRFLQEAPEGRRPFTSHYDWFLRVALKVLGYQTPLRMEILGTFAIQPPIADPSPDPNLEEYLGGILHMDAPLEELIRRYMTLVSTRPIRE